MHEGHRKRMKARFKKEGSFENFAQHEILEMLLYSTIARGNTNPIAHDLLTTFGSLAGVLDADAEELKSIKGIGENSAFLLSMIPSLSQAYNKNKWESRVMLGDTESIGRYAINQFIGKLHEEFHIICMDTNRRVFYSGAVTKGTIDEVAIYPRLVVAEALKHNARYVVLAHNHPSGSIYPSEADIKATRAVITALEAIDMLVLDHVIVAGNSYYSMAEASLLDL
ncbi:MAG: DNA repair protein RadC [Ruminococcaceae bacterium]|nr:DNA repair protein RadC [Oscillospiraceae bacterium]